MFSKRNFFSEEEDDSQQEVFEVDFPENCDAESKNRFLCHCMDVGITKEQAQSLVDFYSQEQEGILEKTYQESENILKDKWGTRYKSSLQKARKALVELDRRLSGRLIPIFTDGYGNNPVLIEMLVEIGNMLEEDVLGMPAQGRASNKAMSTEEFLTKVVFK
ncbi:MAG: hypothetical protein ACRCV3_03665 [Desulfovibrionaceae bacterium]